MESNYPFSTGRSSLLNTETFRNLLGNALENSHKSVIILSAYVKDLCRAFEKLMKSKKKNSYGKVFNVGNNKEITINELILEIQKLTGTNKKVVSEKKRQRLNSSEVYKLKCDYSEFNKLTSWHPKYSLKSGLIEFNNWFLNYKDIYKPLIYNV